MKPADEDRPLTSAEAKAALDEIFRVAALSSTKLRSAREEEDQRQHERVEALRQQARELAAGEKAEAGPCPE